MRNVDKLVAPIVMLIASALAAPSLAGDTVPLKGQGSFSATGQDQYQVTYPPSVLEALIDEAHRLGKKAACYVYGGDGQKNATRLTALKQPQL